ncbi:MAG: TetR/AcrR family transcriptional regulator [Thermodesulfobacteriota bacterium]
MARRDPKPRDSKERILAAALALFGERGYASTSIDDIAARAGLTKGALYYYFEDKEDIARDLHHAIWSRLRAEALEVLDPGASVATNLQRAFEAHLRALQSLPEAHFFLRQFWAVPALDVAGRSEHEASLGLIEDLLRQGLRRGEIERLDVSALARVLAGAFSEATLHVLTTGKVDATLEVVRRLVTALGSGTAKRKAAARPKRAAPTAAGRTSERGQARG